MNSPQIVGLGGYPAPETLEYVFAQARGRKVLYDATASPQYDRPPAHPGATVLSFYPWPPEDLRRIALEHDVIMVAGGNTANLLAVWRVHGFDRILREAWESGVVLTGWSAGMICWFEAGVTDSFGPRGAPEGAPVHRPGVGGLAADASSPALEGMRDGLGFLPGSACPHYDGEELRRPVYRRLVDEGFPAGIALDDAAGAHFVGTALHAVVSSSPDAGGYRVARDGEERLDVTML